MNASKKTGKYLHKSNFLTILLLFFVRMVPLSSQHGYIFSLFLMALSVSMFQQFRACIVWYFLFSIPTLVERVPPFVTLRFFEFFPLRLPICNAFSYFVYF